MKKVIMLIIYVVILCVGCAAKQDQPNIETAIHASIPENKTKTSLSPNGRYRAEAYGTDKSVTAAGLYPYEGIRVVNMETNEVIFKMPGYYVVDFVWSPSGRYLGIYYEARIYGESIVFDTKEQKSISLPKLEDIAKHYGVNEKPQEARPDPYFHIIRWQDEETAIVDFNWNRDNAEPFSGSFTFNVITQKVTYK